MNTFTWIIYLAGLVSKLSPLLGVSGLLWVCANLLGLIISYEREKGWFESNIWPTMKSISFVWLFLLSIFILVPDKETALMMGASEVVSRGSQTEVGSELQKTIVHQLKELRKESK